MTIGNLEILPRWLSRPERVMAAGAVLLASGAVIVIIILLSLGQLHAGVMQEVVKTRSARLATYQFIQASIDAETGQRGFLLTGQQSFLEPYERGRAAAIAQIARLRALTRNDLHLSADIARVELLSRDAFAALDATLRAHRAGTLSQSELIQQLAGSKAVMDTLRQQVATLLRDVEEMVDEARAREAAANAALYRLGAVLAILTLLSVGLTFFALRAERRGWRAAFDALSKANAAAEDARARAAASDAAKTRFLAVASHDMRQPLHALTLYLSALERRVESVEARGIIEKMEHATQSMVSMFATLLDLARIQAGVVSPEIETFAIQDVFDRIVAENPGREVTAEATTLSLRSDPVLIERVLRNLVSNALRHGGGATRMFAVAAGDGHVDLAVSDNGPGIPAEDQDRIFEEFVRLDRNAGSEGLGLGLSIVKRIAGLLNATIRVDSAPGQGARFVLRVRRSGSAETRARDVGGDLEALNGARVLVIDDDPLAREAMAGALRDLGADVRTGTDEQEAQTALADGFAPALIVMDLRIHGELQGVEIARRLLKRLQTPVRVIVVTGDTGAETLAMLRASGFDWLVKPVDFAQLRAAAAQSAA